MAEFGIAYFADGTPYSYHPTGSRPMSRNVGWLDASHPHSTGPVPAEFVRQLLVLAQNPVNLMMGKHWCDLCPQEWGDPPERRDDRPLREQMRTPPPDAVCRFEGEEWTIVGNGEIRVAEPNGTRWTAPRLVVHYVLAHDYQPPAGFVTAVLMGSPLPDPQRPT
jgi:hypothetical protein